MRILMLTQFYPPLIGGIEQHVKNLCIELVARGHTVAVVTLWQPGLKEYELDDNIRIYRIRGIVHGASRLRFIDPERTHAPPLPDLRLVWAIRRILALEQPQIVHAHNWIIHSFLPLKDRNGAKLVVTLHDYGLVCPKLTFIYQGTACNGPGVRKCFNCSVSHYGLLKAIPIGLSNWAMGAAERLAVDMFLPVSQAVAAGNSLIERNLPFEVIPNFIPDDADKLQGISNPCLAQLPGEDYLLFVGAFGHHKGLDVLLHAYADLIGPPPLVLIGYEIAEYSLKSAHLPGNVFILKNWPHKAVMEAWRRSLVALIPSVGPDSCPTVAMEAMIMGRPVIASRIGGLPDLVTDGVTGLLVPPGDPVALRQAIERLLADPALREQMGQAGKRKVVEFQASAVVSRIEQVYCDLSQEQH